MSIFQKILHSIDVGLHGFDRFIHIKVRRCVACSVDDIVNIYIECDGFGSIIWEEYHLSRKTLNNLLF